jgi:ComF family protein
MQILENIVQAICAKVLPTSCIVCNQIQSNPLCHRCLSALDDESLIHYECCKQCALPLTAKEVLVKRCIQCTNHSPYFDETVCLHRYDGMLQEALHQLKYQKRIAYAYGLARAWNHVMSVYLREQEAFCLLTVPLSIEKLHARGFNQSWELARRIVCVRSIQKLPFALKRHHHPAHQAGNSVLARQDAIKGMFYIDDVYQRLLINKTVIVFDDVMTSGATLNEIARVLKNNGVARIINWVLLRTTRVS